MSDNVNAQIASGGTPVNPVAGYLNWQQLQQGRAGTALTVEQARAADIANQQAAMQLELRKRMLAPFLSPAAAPVGQGQPSAGAAPAPSGYLGGGTAGAGAAAPVGAVTAAPLDGQGAGAAPSSGGQASSPYLPAGATAATHSPGMPENGSPIGATVSPYGAVQTMYGVPLPYGQAMAVMSANDPSAAIKGAMEIRRQRLVELLSQPDWQQGVGQAYQEGWIDPQHYQMMAANPSMRNQALLGLSDANTYNGILEKYSGQGLSLNPQTGQPEVSPAAVAAKGAVAQAGAAGESAGKLPYAGPLAAAEAEAAGRYKITEGPTVPIKDAQGNIVGYQPTRTTETALANSVNAPAGYLPPPAPRGTMPALTGGPPGSGGLDPLVGPLPGAAPAQPTQPGGYLWGEGAAAAPAPAATTAAGQSTGAGTAPAAPIVPSVPSGTPQLDKPQQAALDVGVAQSKNDIDAMGNYRAEIAKSAESGVQNNAILDQMRQQSPGFDHGSFTDTYQTMKKAWGSLAQALGGSMPESVSSWEDFQKNAGQLARTTAQGLSSRVGVQELELVQKYLPAASMSSQAFQRIADQQQGLNDYIIAKNAAAADFTGRPAQFESTFNRNVTPGVFILHRMSPADAQTFAAGLKSTPLGRAEWNRLLAGAKFANDHGLFDAVGP